MELSKFLKKLEKVAGPVHLLMAAGGNGGMKSLNLIVSASKFNDIPTSSAIKQITTALRIHVKPEDLKELSRITVLKSTEPAVQAINSAFRIDGGSINLQNCNINGIEIENAIIFKSMK